MDIELQVGILSAAIVFGLLGFALSAICYAKLGRCREDVEMAETRLDDLEQNFSRLKETCETSSQRSSEQSRRIAWLESRIRNPKLLKDEVTDDLAIHETPKLNMTEKRHRVIKLASRGQGPEAIAASLGMLAGEVELIMSLSQAASK